MSQSLLTADGLFHCMVSLGKASVWDLASFRVWRCCSQQLLHSLLMRWRQRWEAGTPEKLSRERGVKSQLISEDTQEKKSQPSSIACGIHREIFLNRHECHHSTKVHYHKSIISVAAFVFNLIDQKLVPIQAYKNPAWLSCTDFRDEVIRAFLHQFFLRLSCLSRFDKWRKLFS